MNKAVLITGGTGFVGRHFCDYLAADGFKIFSLTRNTRPSTEQIQYIALDNNFVSALREIVSKYQIKHCIHIAGKINGTAAELEADNEGLTEQLLDALSPFQEEMKFCYISSVSAAGPLGSYGAAKRRCEEIIQQSDFKNWLILRPSLLYGSYDSKNVASLVRMVKVLPIIPVPGGGSVKLQPLHVADLYGALKNFLNTSDSQPASPNKIYTVAGPKQEPLLSMIREIKSLLNRKTLLISIPLKPLQVILPFLDKLLPFAKLPVQQVSSLHNHPPWDSSSAKEELSFTPRTFAEGIREVLK